MEKHMATLDRIENSSTYHPLVDSLIAEDELIARWRISQPTLWRRRKDPGFPKAIVLGRRRLYRLDAIEAYEGSLIEKCLGSRADQSGLR